MRLLHALYGPSSHAKAGHSTAHKTAGWADQLVPGVPALAQLLVVDTLANPQARCKQPMGQAPGQPAGQVDKAALQLEAAYLLLILLDGLSPQACLVLFLKASRRTVCVMGAICEDICAPMHRVDCSSQC